MAVGKITKQAVDALLVGAKDPFLWDSNLKGFGVRVSKNGDKTYFVQYRTSGGRSGSSKRVKIGKHGSPWTPDAARQHAKAVLSRVELGDDPAAKRREHRLSISVDDLCDRYLKEGVARKKASTIASDLGRINRHIRPILGRRKIVDVTQMHVRDFLHRVAQGDTADDVRTKPRGRAIVTGGKGVASRTLGLLGGIFAFALELGLLSANPVRGVKPFPGNKNERFLAIDDFSKLGEILRGMEVEGYNASALGILKLLMLTGARRGEIDKLKWLEVDLVGNRLNLSDSKTGRRSIPLNSAAAALLSERRQGTLKDQSFVFPSVSGGNFKGTPKIWREVRSRLGQPQLRIHDLRHSFASLGVTQGSHLLVVGKLLGHSNQSTTQRYAHLADDPIRAASEQIGSAISAALASDETR